LKAIIMAGGKGTRLMPISALVPKPMTKLMGLPLLEHIVELLRQNGFTELCMTLGHMPDKITDYFGNGEKFGVSIEYRIEDKPLGTAGGVRACMDFISEDFLVISGDAACDFDLKFLAEQHKAKNADLTMALYSHEEPLRYGTVLIAGDGQVRSFIEKPDWDRVVTDFVNTGIYIVSPRVMELIPENTAADFAKDLFPQLAVRGDRMVGVPMDGYWCDIGDTKSYLQCCMDALDGKLKLKKSAVGTSAARQVGFVCQGAKVDRSAKIEHSIIHSGAKIGENTHVANSVVDGGDVGKNCVVDGTVLCSGARIEDNTITRPGDVVAAAGKEPGPERQEKKVRPLAGKRGLCREFTCSGRAALMRELSNVLWEAGADFSDGINLQEGNCRVHISPMADESAISVEAVGGREKDRIAACGKYFDLAKSLDEDSGQEG